MANSSSEKEGSLTEGKLEVELRLEEGAPEIVGAAVDPTVDVGAGVDDALGVIAALSVEEDAAADVEGAEEDEEDDPELLPAFWAGPTSGCLPDCGVVDKLHAWPARLKVVPYIRQMLKLSGPEHWRQFL